MAAGIGPGDEVITTPLTFAACANVIVQEGAVPVLADVCADDLNLDPEQVERRVSPRTRAVMAVHYAGQPCRMDELLEDLQDRDLPTLEIPDLDIPDVEVPELVVPTQPVPVPADPAVPTP